MKGTFFILSFLVAAALAGATGTVLSSCNDVSPVLDRGSAVGRRCHWGAGQAQQA
jgi:hypothetical protein